MAQGEPGKKIVVIGHSKGGVDFAVAILTYPEVCDGTRRAQGGVLYTYISQWRNASTHLPHELSRRCLGAYAGGAGYLFSMDIFRLAGQRAYIWTHSDASTIPRYVRRGHLLLLSVMNVH